MRESSSLIDHEVVGEFLVEVRYDPDGSDSPRDWDNLGTITQCSIQRNYNISDKHADYKARHPAYLMERFKEDGVYALPLNIADYGSNGIRIRVGDFDPDYDWADESNIDGFIYVTREKIMKEYSLNDPEIAFMHAVLIKDHVIDESQPNAPKYIATSIDKVLRQEIETYQKYLNGEVYGYVVREAKYVENEPCCESATKLMEWRGDNLNEYFMGWECSDHGETKPSEIDPDDHSGEEVESVWGFIGESDYAMSEGKAQAEYYNEQRLIEDERATWMMAL